MSHAKKDPKAPPKFTNRLANETSPYLLQHQHNPVDWYPWGPEAFEKAKKENKPIFLSVGYSACHWCHVMEHEVFENEEAAAAINAAFISIKVDREERPDIDDIYMRYVHMIGQQGGWPMSVVMTPEGVPFFAGTYFPKPHFMALCEQIGKAWKEKGDEIRAMNPKVISAMEEQANAEYKPPENPLSESTLTSTVSFLDEHFDYRAGGLQSPRKFPPHTTMEFLLQLLEKNPKDERARKMLKLTLDRMQIGGIHDHLAGGFHRYATDTEWFLPHFEKMLYDNAQLGRYYSRAAVLFKDDEYARTARGIFDWVLREMTSPEGAFYSALDADSEGEEGLFYVWDKKEIDKILPDDASLFCMLYNIQLEGNYNDEATRRPTGLNIPHLQKSLAEYVKELKLDEAALREKVGEWKQKLMAVRVKRVWPGLDDKILTSWNALMVGSLARGGMYLKEPKYIQAAVKAAEWLLKNQRTPEGRWLATHRKGNSKLAAYLDDHAYLANAFLDLAEATGDARWNVEAAKLVELMDKHFWDTKRSGYFFTADDHEKLLVRMKNPNDNAIPSGNGIAAQALVRLLKVSGDERYAKRAGELFTTFHTLMDLAPVQVESMLLGLDLLLEQGYDSKGKKGGAVAQAKKEVLKIQRGPVIAEFLSGQTHAEAGKPFPFAVKLTVDAGWHVQANKLKDENGIPTRMRLLAPAGVKLAQEKYPDPETLKAPELGGELNVYSGEKYLGGAIPIPADAAGSVAIELEVETQPCDDKRCLAAEKMRFTITVPVAKDAKEVQPLNEKALNAVK